LNCQIILADTSLIPTSFTARANRTAYEAVEPGWRVAEHGRAGKVERLT
jgi:hypothetical protein